MKYLVDANILSEPTKPAPAPNVVEWLRDNEREITVDPIIVGGLRFGILLLPKGKRRAKLERWFDAGVQHLHCLPWEAETGLRWAELLAKLCVHPAEPCRLKTVSSRLRRLSTISLLSHAIAPIFRRQA